LGIVADNLCYDFADIQMMELLRPTENFDGEGVTETQDFTKVFIGKVSRSSSQLVIVFYMIKSDV
jgi:hypothetical protein